MKKQALGHTLGQTVGFIGVGIMGQPMALNLARAGTRLVVWSRNPDKCAPLLAHGAELADTPAGVFEASGVVIVMLASEQAMDEVLARGTVAFAAMVRDRILVHMGTTSPEYSQALERDVVLAGGLYVEAPVSGSRKPAEAGELVCMMAGGASAMDEVRPWLAPMCAETFTCGAVPGALLMKLSVNLFLITMVTGLCEAFHFARAHSLDPQLLRSVLDAGPMASGVSRMKLQKLVAGDFGAQASIVDVLKNSNLVAAQARLSSLATPLLDQAQSLFGQTMSLGLGNADMVAVLRSIEARTTEVRAHAPMTGEVHP